MSASREKKSRQNKVEELTEKQLKAAKEAAAEKRKSVLYTVIGVVCAVLVAALLLWNSGLFQNRVAAVQIGDETYSTAEVSYFYSQAYTQQAYAEMMGAGMGFDYQTDPVAQVYDEESGKTWHEFFVDEAVDALTEVKVLSAKAEEEGVVLSDENKQYVKESMASLHNTAITSGYNSVASYLKAAYGSGMSKGLYKNLLTESALASQMVGEYAETLTYTDEQIEEYYAEHADEMDLFTYSFAKFSGTPEAKTDEAGNKVDPTDKEKADAKALAYTKGEAFRAKLARGGDFVELMEELAEDKTVTSNTRVTASGTTIMTALDGWMKEEGRKAGDVGLVQLEADTYVVEFHGRERNNELPGDVRHILVAAEVDEGATEPTEAQYDAAKARAEQMLADWKAGDATEESFAELAKKESADPGSAANGGLYEGVSSSTGFIEDFANWVVDPGRQVGDTGLVKNTMSSTKGWHILYFCGKGEPVWKTTTENALANEAATQWLEEIVASATVERLEGLDSVG